ncbi:MAG: nucleotidyltransferase substrate binding protein [Deltaproteobacteria bacterium]|jgi:nucleotidyltransferase substrate binding protein (TIGR01987 family)|nr:nucleotidyltransferase substrate binding protein [Deltaproteobacteria bacterium]
MQKNTIIEADENLWKQQFQPYKSSYLLFSKYFKERPYEEYSDLEKIGLVKVFDFVFEFSWQMMSAYLSSNGMNLQERTPREVIRTAFDSKIIEEDKPWIFMLNIRNIASNTCDLVVIDDALKNIKNRYIVYIDNLYNNFLNKLT